MLSGQRAFRRDTAAETMTAILRGGSAGAVRRRARICRPPSTGSCGTASRRIRRALSDRARRRVRARGIVGHVRQRSRGAIAPPAATLVADRRGDGGARRSPARPRAYFLNANRQSRRLPRSPSTPAPGTRSGSPTPASAPMARRSSSRGRGDGQRAGAVRDPAGHLDPSAARPAAARTCSRSSKTGELAVLTNATFINHRLFAGTLTRMTMDGAAAAADGEGARSRLVAGRIRAGHHP